MSTELLTVHIWEVVYKKQALKKMFVCPFPSHPKFHEGCCLFLSLILNFFCKNEISKFIVTVIKVYCVGTEGIRVNPYMYPPECLMSLV